ncbi:MAG TPA: phosphate ABC transporter permease subunit PstC [Gemmataceae bacterium]|jgi:phosphate transport system permease protein|nr:phosphate ABC transporter permease subunit PstC [Gemmataceae bacterium]
MSISEDRPKAAPGGAWHSLRSALGIGSPADWLFKSLCLSSAAVVLVLVVLIVVLLALQAWPAVRTVGSGILLSANWAPKPNGGHYGGLVFVYGSIVTAALAMLLAVPFGVGAATFLAEIATGWLKRAGSFLVELLAAIPSVVYGFWAITFLGPALQHGFDVLGGPNVGGKGLLSAGLVLAIMVVPYVAAISYDVCQAVPRAQREGALALGATRWQTIWGVVLPYARPGIIGGCFLALGRAIGETMAVTMIIGNVNRFQWLPFGQGNTIPSIIAVELPSNAGPLHESALIELGLLLFAITVVMNALARLLIWRMGQPRSGPSLLARLLGRAAPPAPAAPEAPAARKERLPSDSRAAVLVNRLMTGGEGRDMALGLIGVLLLAVAAVAITFLVPDAGLRAGLLLLVAALGVLVVLTTLGALGLCLVATCVPLFLILGFILYRGAGALNWAFFTQLPRPMGEAGGGLANALYGSLMLVGLATLLALPVGLLAAVFLAEYRTSRVGPVVRFFGELLGGVPSIVIGTFVYALVRLFIQWKLLPPSEQFSGWAGAFALACMMVPIVMRSAEEALRLVPQALRNASHALGAHHWQTVLRVSLPAALPAIITGTFLGIARIAGETAPLLMTAFGNDRWSFSPNDKTAFLPLYIYSYSMSPDENQVNLAWAAALTLLTFVMLLNVGIRLLTGKRVVLASRAE